MKIPFPSIEQADQHADENGIVWVGGKLSVENLQNAYQGGIFPWPHEGFPLLWFCPNPRGILELKNFHVPRSALKDLRKHKYRVTFDQSFAQVLEECSQVPREGQKASGWITDEMKEAYLRWYQQGSAQSQPHSVECWDGDELVGGLYGVYVQGVFSGESMFFKKSGASKQCLISLVEQLHKMGHEWFDIQMVTPVLESFGGVYVARSEYLRRVQQAQKTQRLWRIYED